LLEAVFFTARVSVALNGRDNLYRFFSAPRRNRLSAVLRADFRALSTVSLVEMALKKR
jgi:hypothetical protein